MKNRIESGVVEFLYNNNTNDTPGIYIRNEDCIRYIKSLDQMMEFVQDFDNNMHNATLYVELYKFHELFSKVNNPKSITFVETKEI